MGEWLYEQCVRFDELHAGQQRLLADLGISPSQARSAQRRRKNLAQAFAAGRAHARGYAAVHVSERPMRWPSSPEAGGSTADNSGEPRAEGQA
ncbi:hypothetical protein ACWY4P_00815 [Streptomyces sp. LZ34]